MRLLVLALAVLAAPSVVGADDHEAYEETQPSIDDVAATAHPELRWSPQWQAIHRSNLEYTAMLLGFYGDRTIVLKLRNLEPVSWAARLSGVKKVDLVGVNVSHSGTMHHPNLSAYLADRGIHDGAALAGKRFLFADGSIFAGDTLKAITNAAFSPAVIASHAPIGSRPIVNFSVPEARTWVALRAFGGDGILNAGDDTAFAQQLGSWDLHLVNHWEFSEFLPHLSHNSDHYAQRDGRWMAMSRRDRATWSADRWQGQTGTVEAERERGLHFMQDTKAFFTEPGNKQLFRQRIAVWRSIRRAADRGRWERLATILETQHARDPGFGEALSRDVLGMLGAGHSRMKPDLAHDDVLRVGRVAPVAPWLIAKLRGR